MVVRPIDFEDPALENIREKLFFQGGGGGGPGDWACKEPRGVFVIPSSRILPADRRGC